MSRRVSFLRRESSDDLARDGLALDSFRIPLRRRCPDPNLKTFHGKDTLVKQPVTHRKAATAPLRDLRFDHDCVREPRWRYECRPQVNQRNSDNAVGLEHLPLWQAGLLEQSSSARIEIFKIAREIDNLRGIAITPFDVNRPPVG